MNCQIAYNLSVANHIIIMCKPRLKCSFGSLARLSTFFRVEYLLRTLNSYLCVVFGIS